MNTLMALALVSSLLGRQEEKKKAIEWWIDLPKAAENARTELKPRMLYFRTSRQFEPGYTGFEREGASYDTGVVAAAKSFVPVWLDCDTDGSLREKYGMEGRTVDLLFLDPSGKATEVARSHKPRELESQMRAVASRWEVLHIQDAPFEWLRQRARALGDPDIEVRDGATQDLRKLGEALAAALELADKSEDAELRARAQLVRGEEKPAPIVVPVKAHSVQTVGPAKVEFGCVNADAIWGATISGVDFVKVEIIGANDQVRPFVEREPLPKEFGIPKALRIYPRGK